MLQRELLVEGPRALLPGSDRGEHDARAAEGGAGVVFAAKGERRAPASAEERGKGGHHIEAVVVGVVQHDLRETEVVLALREPVQDEGRPDPGTEHRQLHVSTLPAGSIVQTGVDRLGDSTSTSPMPIHKGKGWRSLPWHGSW